MAKTILPIAGAVVGAFFGMPQLGYAIGSLVAAAIPGEAQGPRIGETGAQTSQEGSPRAIIYGTAMCSGNVIASGPLIKREVEENQGGKGGTDVSTEHAYRSYAVRVSEPIAGFLRIWEDDKLVYDMRYGSTMLAESAKWAANKVFYLGDEAQLPDPTLQMIFGVGEVPAHRGSAYVVFIEEDLTDRRGSIPQYRFEVATSVEDVTVDLTKIDSLERSGSTGYGTSTNYFLDPLPLETPGNVWLCVWTMVPIFATNVSLQVKIAGLVVWSRLLSLNAGVPMAFKVQINAPADGRSMTAGVEGTIVGALGVFIGGLTGDEDFFPDHVPGQDPPNSYEPEDPYFGLIRDQEGVLFSAGPIAQYVWGPDSVVAGVIGSPMVLSDIVADIHARCDFPEDKVDVSELGNLVAGLVLAGEYSGADAINTLRSLYLFDRADFDKKIHYPKRGGAVVATLTYDDLVEEPETSRREQAIEYPKKLHLGYQNAVGGYAVAKATSSRSSPDVRVVGETTVQVPVVLTPDQAAQAAAILHKVAYAEAEGEVKLSVPDSFLRFVPSNCIGLALRGRVSRLRIEQMDVAAGIIEFTLRHDRQSAYTSNVTGVPIPAPTPPPPTIVGDSVLAVIDISARIDSEDDLHYLVAATGGMPAWAGATVQRSLDGGASYVNAADVGRGVIMGSLVNDLASASELFTDTTNVIRVRLFRDTLRIEDITETQFLSEGGAFVIMRPDGSSEVLQYRDAVEVSTGVFDLSHLHRGQLNSGASAHLAGAVLVGLGRAVHVNAQSAWIGAELTHRAVSNGESPELADEQTAIYTGKSQREWPVAYLSTTFDGTTLAASWTPRHRLGSEDAPVASINFQGYRVTITNLLQTIAFDTTSQNFSVDASAMALPFSLSVAALNRITGPGEATVEIIGGVLPPSVYRPSGLEVSSTADVAHQIGDTIVIMGRAGASASIAFYDSATFVQDGAHGVAASEPVAAVSEGDLTFCVFAMASGDAKILRFDRLAGFLPTHTVDLTEPITDICVGGGFLWASDPFNGWTLKYDIADLSLLSYVPAPSQHVVSDGATVYAGGVSADITRIDIASMTLDTFPLVGSSGVTGLCLAGGKLIVHEGEVNAYNPSTGTRLLKLSDGADQVSAAGGAVVVFGGLSQPGVVYEAATLTPVASVEDPIRETMNVLALTDQRVLVAVNPTVSDPVPRAQIWIP
ncbi:phage tail protein [Variovorax sp. LT1R16]|uniref:phage tail protein n=1 Tax=Variovorax sp. LT1R16 TaxID=3443728 RepID=UPI003F48C1F4